MTDSDASRDRSRRPLFPRWANFVLPGALLAVGAGVPYLVILVGFGASPYTLNANYQPEQPVPYSHKLHVTELGMDCRYCHTTVEDASFAAIPSTDICMNCHHGVRQDSPKLTAMFESFQQGMPLKWKKVHDLPDYAYFNHSAHVNRGVSCVECHGRVDRMGEEGVHQKAALNMAWCLECHRNPEPNLRPLNEVTDLMWGEHLTQQDIETIEQLGVEGLNAEALETGGKLTEAQRRKIGEHQSEKLDVASPRQMQDCYVCHR